MIYCHPARRCCYARSAADAPTAAAVAAAQSPTHVHYSWFGGKGLGLRA